MSEQHVSVMLDRCVEHLSPSVERAVAAHRTPVIVDATLGLGGHTEALLTKFPELIVIGIDRDEIALERARRRLAPFGTRFKSSHAVFDQIEDVIDNYTMQKAQWTDSELLEAILFYFKRDAFICL